MAKHIFSYRSVALGFNWYMFLPSVSFRMRAQSLARTEKFIYLFHGVCNPCNRLRVVPIFPQGYESKRYASARENHPMQEQRDAAGFSLPAASRFSCVR